MILQRSQIFLTEARTFMVLGDRSWLRELLEDATSAGVGGRELHLNPVPREDADGLQARLSDRVGEDLVPVLQFHPVERIREGVADPSDERLPTPCRRAHRTGLALSHKPRVC